MQSFYFNWSTGKDSAFALYYLQKSSACQIDYLFTSVNGFHKRISMHGLREELLDKQAEAIGIPLKKMYLPEMPSMEEYEKIIQNEIQFFIDKGIKNTAFGDIFLEDLRKYREEKLNQVGIKAHFPLWRKNTKEMIYEFLDLGFKTIVVCVNGKFLDQSFVGRVIDKQFIEDLPANVDPCGENGEFHTFCFDGPIFKNPVSFAIGEVVYKEYDNPTNSDEKYGYYFVDLI